MIYNNISPPPAEKVYYSNTSPLQSRGGLERLINGGAINTDNANGLQVELHQMLNFFDYYFTMGNAWYADHAET